MPPVFARAEAVNEGALPNKLQEPHGELQAVTEVLQLVS